MAAPHRFHPTILREYDVRGIVDESLFTADARALGQAYATIMEREGRGLRIAVGYDGRLSSPDMVEALTDGLAAAGAEVVQVGQGPTPMLYFAVHHLGLDGGIQVTGSHNPWNHNGFKMMIGKASFFGERIQELGTVAADGAFREAKGSVRQEPMFHAYVDRMVQDYHGERPIKAVWDTGNGVAGPAVEAMVQKLPGTHKVLFAEVDGTFPNHHPDPTVPENLVDLIEAVADMGAEIGIGFDGDGDRIGVVDAKGRVLYGDQLIQILASDLLPNYPGAPIIADVKASQTLFDAIVEMGGEPVMWKTGHSLIKAKMAELGAPMSGEMSGHIFYKDNFYGHDDALYVAVRLLDILARDTKTIADWRDAMPDVVNTPEIRVDCPDERKFGVIVEVKERLAAAGADVNDIDGVRVNTPDGWWLLRASNTQAVIVTRAEALDEAGLERLKASIREQLDASQVPVPAILQPA